MNFISYCILHQTVNISSGKHLYFLITPSSWENTKKKYGYMYVLFQLFFPRMKIRISMESGKTVSSYGKRTPIKGFGIDSDCMVIGEHICIGNIDSGLNEEFTGQSLVSWDLGLQKIIFIRGPIPLSFSIHQSYFFASLFLADGSLCKILSFAYLWLLKISSYEKARVTQQ